MTDDDARLEDRKLREKGPYIGEKTNYMEGRNR